MRVLLVHNPSSGDDDHEREEMVELLKAAGHRAEYRSSKADWRRGLAERPELVAVAGGDGTVGEVARTLAGTGTPMTILPTGTANNIARFLGLTGVPHVQLVGGWAGGSLCPFDLGIAETSRSPFPFLESIGLGVLAELMYEIESGGSGYVNELSDRRERIGAAIDVLQRIVRAARPIPCAVRLDGRDYSGEYLLVEVLNFGAAGPNLRLAPNGNGADGALDVVLVQAHERRWLEDHLEAVRTGEEHVSPHRARHAERVTIRCSGGRLHVDDELEENGAGSEVRASVQRHALTFLVPEGVRGSDAA